MGGWINFNGSLEDKSTALFTAESRAYRYGDGLFETMRYSRGKILLGSFHFERLLAGIELLGIRLNAIVTPGYLESQVLRTIRKNKISGDARVRLSVFRGEGGLYETDGPGSGFLVQVWAVDPLQRIQENGLVMGTYTGAAKNCDILSTIKSNNYLVYVMAALHAKANRWNECLVLNNHGRACDATIANIFWVKSGQVFTIPLTEGCVAGVMRRNLIAQHKNIREQQAEIKDLEEADEIFLTNAISGIRWVREFNGFQLTNRLSSKLFSEYIVNAANEESD